MSTYVLSSHAQIAHRGNHRRPASGGMVLTRWLATLAAFIITATALSSGLLLLSGQGVDLRAAGPALTLICLAGVGYVMMLWVFHHLKFA